jgi:hypothetical protein
MSEAGRKAIVTWMLMLGPSPYPKGSSEDSERERVRTIIVGGIMGGAICGFVVGLLVGLVF